MNATDTDLDATAAAPPPEYIDNLDKYDVPADDVHKINQFIHAVCIHDPASRCPIRTLAFYGHADSIAQVGNQIALLINAESQCQATVRLSSYGKGSVNVCTPAGACIAKITMHCQTMALWPYVVFSDSAHYALRAELAAAHEQIADLTAQLAEYADSNKMTQFCSLSTHIN